jgi:hypothetical protein
MPNGFSKSWMRRFSRNVEVRLGMQGRREGKATSHSRWILQSAQPKNSGDTVPELQKTTFMVVIHRVPNGNNDQARSKPLEA